MNKFDLYICYTKPVDKREVEIISKYWELEDKKAYSFNYKINDLVKDFGFKKQYGLTTFITRRSFVTSSSSDYNCPACSKKLKASNRTQLQKLILKKKPCLCDFCRKEHVKNTVIRKKNKVTSSVKKLALPIFDEVNYRNLDYLSKIALMAMLHDNETPQDHPVKFIKGELNLSGCPEYDEEIINNLLGKGAIHVVDDEEAGLESFSLSVRHFLSTKNDYIDSNICDYFNSCLRQNFKHDMYFLVPTSFNDFEKYKSSLFEEVISSEINMLDVDEIINYVNKYRLDQAYKLLKYVTGFYEVPVDLNIKLNFILIRLIEKYSLLETYNIINSIARSVSSKIRSHSMPIFVKNKLLSSYIEKYLLDTENDSKAPRINLKYLPKLIVGSKIEYFTSCYIMGGLKSWNDLSLELIIKKWLNSPTLKILS